MAENPNPTKPMAQTPASPTPTLAPVDELTTAQRIAQQVDSKKSENAVKTPAQPSPHQRPPTTRQPVPTTEFEVSEQTKNAFTEGNEDVGHTLTESGSLIESEEEKQTKAEKESSDSSSSILKIIKSILVLIGILLAVLLFFNFVIKTYKVDGSSMYSTLDDGDRLLVNALGKTWASVTGSDYIPKRGDIVILNSPDGDGTQFIKRVIGLPGERVLLENEKYTVFNDEFPQGFDPDTTFEADLKPTTLQTDIVVPEAHIFVSGDNRTAGGSYDSRSFGPVSVDELVGSAFFRFLPVSNMKAL